MELYSTKASDEKANAQRNLQGRTHYVDDDTLRFHHSRIISARAVDNGLLFAIVESVALDYQNKTRGFRYVVFDVFGNVVSRVDLEHCWKRSDQATKAMWAFLDGVDAYKLTADAIDVQERRNAQEIADARNTLTELRRKAAA